MILKPRPHFFDDMHIPWSFLKIPPTLFLLAHIAQEEYQASIFRWLELLQQDKVYFLFLSFLPTQVLPVYHYVLDFL